MSLVRKLIAVLESIEKLPVFTYDSTTSGSYGLQVLTRRLRFRLEKSTSDGGSLIDRSGCSLKMEPLTTITALEKYLLKMVRYFTHIKLITLSADYVGDLNFFCCRVQVAKQWYDHERPTYSFVKLLKEPTFKTLELVHKRDFDENGVVYWIGTNAKTSSDWVNPASVGLVCVTSSEGKSLPYGKPEDILSRESAALNCHTNDDKRAWFAIDLGVWLVPTCYTLRHARGYGRSALRNWQLQVSKDGQKWTTLFNHTDDSALNDPGYLH